jgi:hypothetical protein
LLGLRFPWPDESCFERLRPRPWPEEAWAKVNEEAARAKTEEEARVRAEQEARVCLLKTPKGREGVEIFKTARVRAVALTAGMSNYGNDTNNNDQRVDPPGRATGISFTIMSAVSIPPLRYPLNDWWKTKFGSVLKSRNGSF